MKIRKSNISFFCGYILWVLCSSFLVTIDKNIYYYTKIFALFIFIASIIFNKWKKEELIRFIAFSSLCFWLYFHNKEEDFIILPILLMASKNTNIYEIAKVDLPVRILGICCTIFSYIIGVIPGNTMSDVNSFFGYRMSLGYYHPNNLFAQIFLVSIGILLCYNKKLKIKHYLWLIIFVCVFGIITYSRTGMLLLSLLIIIIAFYKDKLEFKMNLKKIIEYSFVICFLVTIIGTLLFLNNNSMIIKIDEIMSGRFRFAARFIDGYGISMWGNAIQYSSTLESTKAVVLDNLYAYLLISCGIVFTLVLLYLLTKQQKILIKNKEYVLAIIIFVYALYSITEKVYFSSSNNYTLLLLSIAITSKEKIITYKKSKSMEKS